MSSRSWTSYLSLDNFGGQIAAVAVLTYSVHKAVYCATTWTSDYDQIDEDLANLHKKTLYGLFWPVSSVARKGTNTIKDFMQNTRTKRIENSQIKTV